MNIDSQFLIFVLFLLRIASKQTHTIEKLIKKLEQTCNLDEVIITARTIQLVAGSLNRLFLIVPKLSERMLIFVNENMDIVGADTTASLLFYLFSMGYEPYADNENTVMIESNINDTNNGNDKNIHKNIILTSEFDFANFIRIINRDFDFLPAWSIVQACLALSFYQVLTLDLIQRVFNIDFVTRLEKEISLNQHSVLKIFCNFFFHLFSC